MVRELRIYFEGDPALRPGFRQFLNELYLAAAAVSVKTSLIATRGTPVDRFNVALRQTPGALNILLLDSEGPVDGEEAQRRLAGIPAGARGQVFWMVQVMESWFLADADALARFYGQGLSHGPLKQWADIESIGKADVLRILHDATHGKYHKTAHAPRLLATIGTERVREKSAHCRRLFHQVPSLLEA